ncbi:hypothetical protein MUK42_10566 [Musa troglodytarum]|uniref:Uncharacterized protein n=1 Tax=Musa troglodytarum TaxID=320322 RepID=A0A9E7GRA0_9LILI|nr:hypothetical protein MUK42_10566 [Musa troglodytarum]
MVTDDEVSLPKETDVSLWVLSKIAISSLFTNPINPPQTSHFLLTTTTTTTTTSSSSYGCCCTISSSLCIV